VTLPDPGITRYWRGIRRFNDRAFSDAHEVLEDVWRTAPVSERAFLQGLIQVAVGLHHYSRGNRLGAASLLARAEKNFSGYADAHGGLDVAALRAELRAWQEALAARRAPPELPRLRVRDAKIQFPRTGAPAPNRTRPRRRCACRCWTCAGSTRASAKK